jgi:beta-galactosidase
MLCKRSYIHWALHNPKDNDNYNWEGIADIERFVQLAQDEDLYVILRPGPYICAEIDNGGLPYWLATKYPDIQVRTNDTNYIYEITKWYNVLMPKFERFLYGNGGKIIMVQVENEYGAYKACDNDYKEYLRDLTLNHVQNNALLFTTDRPIDDELSCGLIENVFATVDFGIATADEVKFNFDKLRQVQPKGPLVNSEFYTGWLTHWQEPNARRDAKELAETMEIMLDAPYHANVNFYMYFGGTNYGFWAGANDWGIGKYMADITSYDYDAPLSEPGDTTAKYLILRNVILNVSIVSCVL